MATDLNVLTLTLPGAADYSSYQYCCIKSVAGVATLCASQGEDGIGILYTNPDAAGKDAVIAMLNGSSVVKVLLGATVAADALVTPEATTGRMGAVATGDYVWGRLKTGGDDGEIVEMYPAPMYVSA